jgi:nicotinamidase-related amidase
MDAVQKLGVEKLIMAGIATDVCLTFAALSGETLGYDVYAVVDASGTFSMLEREMALYRMQANGVTLMSWFAVGSELLNNWNDNGGTGFMNLI